MLIGEIILVALGAIRANKLRSFLTTLGIVIGVAAVITMVALGTGAQRAVEEQIEALGTDLLTIQPGQSFWHGVASADRVALTSDDYEALRAEPYALKKIVPEISRNMQVKFGNQNINVSVVATTADYPEVQGYTIEAGNMFSHGDDETRRRVAMLGHDIPNQLNSNGAAMIGQQILIGGIPFEIVGLLGEKGAVGWSNPDERILIPFETGQYRVFGTDRLRSITVQVMHPDSMTVAMIGVERVMRREHSIRPGQDNDFQIRNRAEFLTTAEETTQTFTFLLAGVALVSLVVGGIGIMNIMLVSVTERTHEIGIRKAMGATKQNILLQFLVEALTLCLMGGLIGIAAGAAGAYAMSASQGWNTMISPAAVALAFMFSAAVGIFFGLWPARRASLLDPMTALRSE